MSQNPVTTDSLTADDGWHVAGVIVATRGRIAWRGLRPRPAGRALLIRCRSIHTASMREPLRVVAIAPGGEVVESQVVVPWRLVTVREARWMLELPADDPGPGIGAVVAGPPLQAS